MMEELLGSSFLLGASSLLVWSKLATARLAAARPSSALRASACSLSSRFCLASAISCGKLSTSPNTCPRPPNKPTSTLDHWRLPLSRPSLFSVVLGGGGGGGREGRAPYGRPKPLECVPC